LDTNVALKQIDLFEHQCSAFPIIIVLQTVLQEIVHNNLSLGRRMHELMLSDTRPFIFFANEHHCQTYIQKKEGESPNDRNDRAIREATAWFVDQVGELCKVILLTNDRLNKEAAIASGLFAKTIHDYVKEDLGPEYPELNDLLAQDSTEDGDHERHGKKSKSNLPSPQIYDRIDFWSS